jgi:hypothetical protein
LRRSRSQEHLPKQSLEHKRTSPHEHHIDAVASSLLRLQYASEVIRQHLHEWLRFSLTIDAKGVKQLPAANAEIVRHYVAEGVAGCSAWAAAPADPAAFEPPPGSSSMQVRKDGFAVALAGHLPSAVTPIRPSPPAWFGETLTL